MKISGILLLFFIVLSSCVKQAPQLPANKTNRFDSAAVALVQVNERLIESEDSLLKDYVSKSDSNFVKHETGFWYKINQRAAGTKPKANVSCSVNYSVYTLGGDFLFRKDEAIVVGKKQIIKGVEEALLMMHPGEKATLIVPWYLAYGMKGNPKEVDLYTSIVLYINYYK